CLQWAAAGKTSYEVGIILTISKRTVDFHIYNACQKLGVHSRQMAVAIAIEQGLFPNIRQLLPALPSFIDHDDPAQVLERTRQLAIAGSRQHRQSRHLR